MCTCSAHRGHAGQAVVGQAIVGQAAMGTSSSGNYQWKPLVATTLSDQLQRLRPAADEFHLEYDWFWLR